MKKLSIITICLNEPNVEKTCESIVNQTWQDFEWIVVDGGSNADTLAIFEKYKGRIDKFISEPDEGIYDACNKGIKLASGEFVNFMNAGDCFYDDVVLEKLLDITALKDEADIYYGQSVMYHNAHKYETSKHPKNVSLAFFLSNNINTQAMFIKKELFLKYGFFDKQYKIAADNERWLCFLSNKVVFKSVPIIVAIYNMNGISNSKVAAIEAKNVRSHYLTHFTQEEIEEIENTKPTYKWLQLIFSIKNSLLKGYKIITIFGFRIKIKK